MNRFLTGLTISALAFAAAQATMFASPVRPSGGDLEVVVNGAPLKKYPHGGRWYIEALKGREYSITLRNPYPVRVAVALSVDGLNTIDARETTAFAARKWVLQPYETVTISGWQTSRTEARRFEFTTEAASYGAALGKTSNLGMISAVFFKERVAAVSEPPKDDRERRQAAPASPSASKNEREADKSRDEQAAADYAATGMGRRTDHAVTQVWLDLESTPANTVNIRYEFRPQLVRLGILPPAHESGALQRRERARGFEPGFSPVPPGLR